MYTEKNKMIFENVLLILMAPFLQGNSKAITHSYNSEIQVNYQYLTT